MELKLENLAPYLPYRLNMHYESECRDWVENWELTPDKISYALEFNNKPILRPLSDLTKEITVNGETFVPIKKLGTRYSSIKCMLYENTVQLDVHDTSSINLLHYLTAFEKLYDMHFDIHNLIENDLAIDINTLK